jgi:hypothetical protein
MLNDHDFTSMEETTGCKLILSNYGPGLHYAVHPNDTRIAILTRSGGCCILTRRQAKAVVDELMEVIGEWL